MVNYERFNKYGSETKRQKRDRLIDDILKNNNNKWTLEKELKTN